MVDTEHVLRSLALQDTEMILSALHIDLDGGDDALDPKTCALVRLATIMALEAGTACYVAGVEDALTAGASVEEVAGTLIAVAPWIGVPRVVAAAPRLGRAAGFDIGSAFEEVD